MTVETALILTLIGFFISLLFLGVPVGFSLGGSAFATTAIAVIADTYFGAYTGLTFVRFSIVADRVFDIMTNEVLVALPMFILMGNVLDQSGVAEHMMNSQQKLFGRFPGGLAIGVTLMGVLLAASTGIIGASVVLLGTLSLPAMMKANYSPSLAAGTVCSAGTLGILIPPSIMLILMADQLNVSTGDLFMGAVLPGMILSAMYLVFIFGYAFFKPEVAPKPARSEPLKMGDIVSLLLSILPALFLIILVLGSIFFGIATPTESSGMGALGAIILTFANRKFKADFGPVKETFLKSFAFTGGVFKKATRDTLRTMGFLFAIFVGATCFSLVLRRLGGDEIITDAILGIGSGHHGTILVVLGIIFLLGFFLEWIEITLIMLPIVGPIIGGMDFAWIAESGMDSSSQPALIWFAILCAVALQTSFLTPPVGFALFFVKGVAPKEIELKHIYRGVIPFVAIQLIALLLVLLFPQLVTWLPAISY